MSRNNNRERIQENLQTLRLNNLEAKFNNFVASLEARLATIADALGTARPDVLRPVINEGALQEQSKASWLHLWDYWHETAQNYQINKMKANFQYLFDLVAAIDNLINDNSESLGLSDNNAQISTSLGVTDVFKPIFRFMADNSRSSYSQNKQNREITDIENNLGYAESDLNYINARLSKALFSPFQDTEVEGKITTLMKCGASAAYVDNGCSALEWAFNDVNQKARLAIFIEYSSAADLAIPFSNGRPLLYHAITHNDIILSTKLVTEKHVPLDQTFFDSPKYLSLSLLSYFVPIGTTSTHKAIENGNTPLVQLLYDNGAKMNIVDNNGNTAQELLITNREITIHMNNNHQASIFGKMSPMVSMQTGYFISDFFIVPTLECANPENYEYKYDHSRHFYHQKYSNFFDCYNDKIDKKHLVESLKVPAITLALYTIHPAAVLATKPAVMLFDAYQDDKPVSAQELASCAVTSIAQTALFYPVLGLDPFYKHYSMVYGLMMPIAEYCIAGVSNSHFHD